MVLIKIKEIDTLISRLSGVVVYLQIEKCPSQLCFVEKDAKNLTRCLKIGGLYLSFGECKSSVAK